MLTDKLADIILDRVKIKFEHAKNLALDRARILRPSDTLRWVFYSERPEYCDLVANYDGVFPLDIVYRVQLLVDGTIVSLEYGKAI